MWMWIIFSFGVLDVLEELTINRGFPSAVADPRRKESERDGGVGVVETGLGLGRPRYCGKRQVCWCLWHKHQQTWR